MTKSSARKAAAYKARTDRTGFILGVNPCLKELPFLPLAEVRGQTA
jgi:hypothetical protein